MSKFFGRLFLLVLSMNAFYNVVAQNQAAYYADSAMAAYLIEVNGGISQPIGLLSNRFGFNGVIGIGFKYKTEQNWVWGVEGDFLFGSNVKEDTLLNHISTADGFLIGSNGLLIDPVQYERGWHIRVSVGKILIPHKENPNSGWFGAIGLGYLQHRIFYQTQAGNSLPHLNEDYLKGYDRLTAGSSLSEFFGYHLMSRNTLVNFRIGLDFTQALTRNQRSINFDSGRQDKSTRLDILLGLRATWMLPIYRAGRRAGKVIYY